MSRMLRLLATAAMVAGATILSGCATGYLLDNRVQSFSNLPALPANPTYRLERLPSQQADPVQAQVEALADAALFKAGLRRDDSAPRYSVQVSARVQRVLSPYADPWWGGFGGFGWGFWGRRGGIHGGFPLMESPWYQREVGVVVRELATNRVVYESHASNDGPWFDSTVALPAMFDAALQGFPNPPQGPRRVDIQLGNRAR